MKEITAESLRIEREKLEKQIGETMKELKESINDLREAKRRMEEKQSGEFHVTEEQMVAYLKTIVSDRLLMTAIELESIVKEHPDTPAKELASDLYAVFEKRAWMHAQKENQLPKCDYCGLTKCYCCPECGMDVAEGEHADACIHNGPLSVEE